MKQILFGGGHSSIGRAKFNAVFPVGLLHVPTSLQVVPVCTLQDYWTWGTFCIASYNPRPYSVPQLLGGSMQIDPIDERISELCAKAVSAQGSEVETVISELRAALKEHSQYVRYLAAQTLNHLPEHEPPSPAKSAA